MGADGQNGQKHKGGRPPALDAAGEARVIELRRQGLSRTDIVAATGVSDSTVGRVLRAAGVRTVPILRLGGRMAIARLYKAGGETYESLARRFGLPQHVVAGAVREHGTPARRGRPSKGDPRRGRGRKRAPGDDYPRDDLGRRGREAWASWLSAMTPEERTAVMSAVAGLEPLPLVVGVAEVNPHAGTRQREERRDGARSAGWDQAWPSAWEETWRDEPKARALPPEVRRARVEKLSAAVRATGGWGAEACAAYEQELREAGRLPALEGA